MEFTIHRVEFEDGGLIILEIDNPQVEVEGSFLGEKFSGDNDL